MLSVTYAVGRHPFKYIMAGILKRLIPNTTKRMILLISIIAFIKNMQEPDEDILIQLRLAFGFEQTYDSYQIPWRMSKFIWKPLIQEHGTLYEEVCRSKTEKAPTRVVSEFLSKMPSWLMYSSQREMEREIYRLMTLC